MHKNKNSTSYPIHRYTTYAKIRFAAAAIYDYEYRIRRKEWSAQRLDDAARETEEP